MRLANTPTAELDPPDLAWPGGGYRVAYDVALTRVAEMHWYKSWSAKDMGVVFWRSHAGFKDALNDGR